MAYKEQQRVIELEAKQAEREAAKPPKGTPKSTPKDTPSVEPQDVDKADPAP